MGDGDTEDWLKFETQHIVEEELALADEKVDQTTSRPPVHRSQIPKTRYDYRSPY